MVANQWSEHVLDTSNGPLEPASSSGDSTTGFCVGNPQQIRSTLPAWNECHVKRVLCRSEKTILVIQQRNVNMVLSKNNEII
jgi:hypothetical protein